MKIKKHTIGTLHFDLTTDNKKLAQELQERVSRFGGREIPAIMEESLEATGIDDSLGIIERMEIDLGEINREDFQDNFLTLFRNRFADKLSEFYFDQKSTKTDVIQKLDPETSEFEVIRHFLLTGTIPWYEESTPPDLQKVFRKLVESKSENIIRFVRDHISYQVVVQRLVYQFPEALVTRLIEEAFEINIESYEQFADQLFRLLKATREYDDHIFYPGQLKRTILIQALSNYQKESETGFAEHFLKLLSSHISESYTLLLQKFSRTVNEVSKRKTPSISQEFLSQIKSLIQKGAPVEEEKLKVKTRKQEPSEEESLPVPEEDKLVSHYIMNAGLVLLHGFLPELFRKTKLLHKNEIVDEIAQHKAIHLSQYAVFGNKVRPEYLLVLNKLLCGYPLEKPLPVNVLFSKNEKSEATRMVSSAIKHWSALKNTSVKGFRNAFLQREGLLKKTEQGWRLFVERAPHDVLLDRIPWNYHIVKLPWMDEMIEVEW